MNGIVSQELRLCGKKNKDSLPLSWDEDKFETFCKTYKDYIGISKSHEMFARIWEDEKMNADATLTDKLCIPLLFCALYKSFPGDFYKAVILKLEWSVLIIFSIWFFVLKILDFIKARSNEDGVSQEILGHLIGSASVASDLFNHCFADVTKNITSLLENISNQQTQFFLFSP